ncbi:MAG TPA: hypothetical protein VLI04_14245 [Nocardioidaceae bacterium]|nr:hypothetical protein [Nocardioidaceae bacterium]
MVFLDFRIDGFDLIPDPVGWVMAGVATAALANVQVAGRSWFSTAAVVCFVMSAVAVPDWFGGKNDLIDTATAAATTLVVFSVCSAIMAAVPARRVTADRIRWWDLGLTLAGVPLLIALSENHDLAFFAFAWGAATLAVLVWFLVLLFGTAKLPPTGIPMDGGSAVGAPH